MDLDKFGEFKHGGEGVKYARRSFWKEFIFDSFDLRAVFWELRKIGTFSGEGYFWKNCISLPEL